jgi:hypothetical protein
MFLLVSRRMRIFTTWPEWLLTAALAALVAVLGFLLKEGYSYWGKRREARRQAARQLSVFGQLLAESELIAATHFELRDRLYSSLGAELHPGETYNDFFARLHNTCPPAQQKLFQLLRSNTMHSMRPQNQALLDWATAHTAKDLFGAGPEEQAFDEQLALLREHLRVWRDKYHAGFEAYAGHSIVYLNDEDRHGKPFPGLLKSATATLLAKHPVA